MVLKASRAAGTKGSELLEKTLLPRCNLKTNLGWRVCNISCNSISEPRSADSDIDIFRLNARVSATFVEFVQKCEAGVNTQDVPLSNITTTPRLMLAVMFSNQANFGFFTFALCFFDDSSNRAPFLMSLAVFSSASTCEAMRSRACSARPCGRTTTPFRSAMMMSPGCMVVSWSSLLNRTGAFTSFGSARAKSDERDNSPHSRARLPLALWYQHPWRRPV